MRNSALIQFGIQFGRRVPIWNLSAYAIRGDRLNRKTGEQDQDRVENFSVEKDNRSTDKDRISAQRRG